MQEAMDKKQIALVTGTSSGFGLLISIELAKIGFHVIATMRDMNRRGDLLEVAQSHGLSACIECLPLDVTDHQAIRNTVRQVIDQHGRIDVLVNNAGISLGGFVEEIPYADWVHAMDTNFFGIVVMTQEVLPHMRAAKSGKIINISSVSGRLGFPGYGPYAASKFALEGFSESLRFEMLPYGIHVSLVEPGAYQTAIWSKGFDSIALLTKADSPYQKPLAAIVDYGKNLVKHASDPRDVAKTVVRIVQSRYPRLRYAQGKGALVAIWGKALLPWKWFEQILLRQLRK